MIVVLKSTIVSHGAFVFWCVYIYFDQVQIFETVMENGIKNMQRSFRSQCTAIKCVAYGSENR